MMCDSTPLTFETLLKDPMARAVMRSDGVSVQDLVTVLCAARQAVVVRERATIRRAWVHEERTNARTRPAPQQPISA